MTARAGGDAPFDPEGRRAEGLAPEPADPHRLPEAVRRVLRGLAPPDVAVAVDRICDRTAELWPEEHIAVAGSPAQRLAEFSTGRRCARQVLAAIGIPPGPIPMGLDGVPAWPAGVAASLSHGHGLCAAVAALKRDTLALGLDLEWAEGVEGSLLSLFTSPEHIVARNLSQVPAAVLPACLFSTCEAVFKAYYPATGVFLDFSDLDVDLHASDGRFHVRLTDPSHPPLFGTRTIKGRFGIVEGFVVALAVVNGSAG